MNTEALVRLRAYWEDLRDGRVAPYRAELDPRKFDDVLPAMFILEQLNTDQVRVRLGGQDLCEMMGMEVRGMPPEAFVDAADRGDFIRHVNTVLSRPAVAELDLSATDPQNRRVRAQMLLLPLRSDFGEVSRILGCVITDRRPVRAPVNFTVDAVRIVGIHVSDPGSGASDGLPGFAEPAPSFTHRPLREVVDNPSPVTSEPRRGHLRVVSGGEG